MEPRANDRHDDRRTLDACPQEASSLGDFPRQAEQFPDGFIASAALQAPHSRESRADLHSGLEPFDNHLRPESHASISVAEFVIQRFIPECVAGRRTSARAHFQTVLNHVLHPELVSSVLSTVREGSKKRLTTISGWPYIDALPVCDVDAQAIQRLLHAVLMRGYSTQMARQIRNVCSLIMSHAIRTGYHTVPNPATLITLSATPKKEAHTLSFAQLTSALRIMAYPERYIAVFLILAELRVTEICALQWKYVNLSPGPRFIEGEVIPPKTIAVRNQMYRGEFTKAVGRRKRFVRIPDLLCSLLRDLRSSQRLAAPDTFVLASRNGTPVHPENIAARRLRFVGNSLGMPWLSWSVFVRTRNLLGPQSSRALPEQLQEVLFHPSNRQYSQDEIQERIPLS